jgi:hypothetical protein
MSDNIPPELVERYHLNSETGRLSWPELARYFAAGKVVLLGKSLDLVDVAQQFSRDNAAQTAEWLNAGKINLVTDEQAKEFHEQQTEFWAIVVKPWVLVQLI